MSSSTKSYIGLLTVSVMSGLLVFTGLLTICYQWPSGLQWPAKDL
jgi:hypothetical protein